MFVLTVRSCFQRKLNQVRLASEGGASLLVTAARSVTSNAVAMLPVISTKKERSCCFVLFLSKSQAWYIIRHKSVYHHLRCISSRLGVYFCDLMIYNFYEIGDYEQCEQQGSDMQKCYLISAIEKQLFKEQCVGFLYTKLRFDDIHGYAVIWFA